MEKSIGNKEKSGLLPKLFAAVVENPVTDFFLPPRILKSLMLGD